MADAAVRISALAARSRTRPVVTARVLSGVALAVVAAATAVGLHAHAMWFDELQAWNIARASHSLPDLFANLRYEGHPVLWYLPLYALTRVTGDPRWMQAAQLVVVVATYALVLFRSPFSLPARIAIVAGYFVAFEYGAITRSYGLGVLLLVATLVFLARPRPAWGAALTTAALLAWTSVAGAVLAGAIACTVVLASNSNARGIWSRVRALDGPRRRFVLGVGAGGGAAALTCIPPADFHDFAHGLGGSSSFGSGPITSVASAVSGTWRGLFPLPARFGGWNTQLLDGLPAAVWIEAALSVAIFVVVLRALRPSPFAQRLWIVGSAGLLAFFALVILPEESRYAGQVFLLFLACCWLALAPPGADRLTPADATTNARPALLRSALVVVLTAQVVATLAVYPSTSVTAFSPDRAVAAAARAAGLSDTLVSGADFDAATVGGYLDRSTYSVARHAWTRFFVHDDLEARGVAHLTNTAVLCAGAGLARRRGRAAGVIVSGTLAGTAGVSRVVDVDGVALYRVAPSAAVVGCAS
jgi:hypothetical protein